MSERTEANHFTYWFILSFRWGRRPAGWVFRVLVSAETDRVLNNAVRRLCWRRRCSVEMNCEIWWTDRSNELILDIQWDSNELTFPWQQTGSAATRRRLTVTVCLLLLLHSGSSWPCVAETQSALKRTDESKTPRLRRCCCSTELQNVHITTELLP